MNEKRILMLIVVSLCLAVPHAIRAQQSYRTQESFNRRSAPLLSGDIAAPVASGNSRPLRFLGWKDAAKQGPAAVRHFIDLDSWPKPLVSIHSNAAQQDGGQEKLGRRNSVPSSNLPGILLRPTLPAGLMPTSVAAGDFNKDGKADWVITNGGDNTLYLYLGNGDGTAQPPAVSPLVGKSPVSVAAADLNGDGNLDVVIAESDSQTIGILFGNGNGTFQPEVELPAFPTTVMAVAAADLNKDGFIDLVVGVQILPYAGATGRFAALLNDGTGHFGSPVYAPPAPLMFPSASELSIADVNSDGIPDVLATGNDEGGGSTQIFLGIGDGTFSSGEIVDSSIYGLPNNAVLADVNGDGCPDTIVADIDADAVVFLGNCQGTFSSNPSVYGMGDVGYGLTVADINGDGSPDLIIGGDFDPLNFEFGIGDATGNSIGVRLNDGTGNFGVLHTYRGDSGIFSLAAIDLNGSGIPDIVTANQDSNDASVYVNDGTGAFGEPSGGYDGEYNGVVDGFFNSPASGFFVTDLNGDGKPDLSVIEYPDQSTTLKQVTVMFNQGNGLFSAPVRSPMFAEQGDFLVSDFLFGDFRGDGQQDFLGTSFDDDENCDPPELVYAPNLGNGKFGTPVPIPFPVVETCFAASILGVGDFNNDGKLDFAVASETGPSNSVFQLTIYLGGGDGTFKQASQINFGGSNNAAPYPQEVFVEDANQDGKPDIFVWLADNTFGPGVSGKSLLEFIGNGDGTFQPPITAIPELDQMTMVDLNHDGLLDVIQLETPGQYGLSPAIVSIYLGQPNGSFGSPISYFPFSGDLDTFFGNNVTNFGNWTSPYIGDFNGDGNTDIALFQYLPSGGLIGFGQFLVGNGDGTFFPAFDTFSLGTERLPDLTLPNAFGDGRTAFLQTPNYSASFHLIPTEPAPQFQVSMATTPLTDTNGALEVVLNVAGQSNTTISLTSSDARVQVPASVTIPGGAPGAEVPFTLASGFPTNQWFTITGQESGSTTAIAYDFLATPGSLPAPFATLNPPQLYFQNVNVGASASQMIELSNSGTAPLTIDSINSSTNDGSSGAFASSSNCEDTLAVNSFCAITVTYTASSSGGATGSVKIGDNAPGSAQAIPLSASNASFALQLANGSSGTATISAGGAATFNLSIVPNEFQGNIAISCTGAPPQGSCSVNPATVAVSSDSPIAVQAVVMTTANSLMVGRPVFPDDTQRLFVITLWLAALALFLMGFYRVSDAKLLAQHRKLVLMYSLAIILAVGTQTACGGGGSGGSSSGGTSNGTPAGTYNVVVSATASGITQSLSLAVTVK